MLTSQSNRLIVAAAVTCSLFAIATPAWSQALPPRVTHEIDLSGPRFGMTMLGQASVDKLMEKDIVVKPTDHAVRMAIRAPAVCQQGRAHCPDRVGATRFRPRAGVALPSLNWLVGVRTPTGTEFGVGPNITPLGVGLVIAAGCDGALRRAEHPTQLRRRLVQNRRAGQHHDRLQCPQAIRTTQDTKDTKGREGQS